MMYKELHEELLRNTELYNAEIKGKESGIIEGKLDDARKMLKDNLDIDTIIKYTGLTKEEIEGLRK